MTASTKRQGGQRVLLVDDHPTVLEALATAVWDQVDLTVCGMTGAAAEALTLVETTQPHVAVVDLVIEGAHGLDLVQNMLALAPDLKIVVFSLYDEKVYAKRALQVGARAYLMKTEPTRHVIDAIRSVLRGDVYLSQAMTARMLSSLTRRGSARVVHPIDTLTDRELSVLKLLGHGLSLSDIAERLSLSQKTVETYRRRAKEKLDLETTAELLQFAVRWIEGQPPRVGREEANNS